MGWTRSSLVLLYFVLAAITLGCALKKDPAVAISIDDHFLGEWEIKSVSMFEEDMGIIGKAEVMPDHTFRAYWIQSLPSFSDERTDFSGRWILDETVGSLKLDFVVSQDFSSGRVRKDSVTATLKYDLMSSINDGSRHLILSRSGLEMLREIAKQKGQSEEKSKEDINALPQDAREDLEKLLVEIVLWQKSK